MEANDITSMIKEEIKNSLEESTKLVPERLLKVFSGKDVIVYCYNGSVFRGEAEFLENGWLFITLNKGTDRERHHVLNPDHIISITLQ